MVSIPAVTPVTSPLLLTVAEVLVADHVPPEVASVNEVDVPVHTKLAPDIAFTIGNVFTVTV